MDRVSLYIKKLIVILLSALLVYFLSILIFIPWAAAIGLLVLSFLHYKVTNIKPDYLFGLRQAAEDLNRKGGAWLLLKWIVLFFGLVYDILCWTIFGIYILFMFFIDILLLINTVIYWIIFAVLWFLKLFVPAFVFLFKIVIHYLFFWPWWIFRLCFDIIERTVNKNFFLLAVRGAVLSIFTALVFFGAALLVNLNVVWIIGLAFAILPVIWTYGEIAALRKENREDADYNDVKMRYASGFDAIRAVLFYFSLFVLLLILEFLFNAAGLIPRAGFTILGLSLTINTFLSLILLFIFVILVFAKFMMPPHVVEKINYRNDLKNGVEFIGVIGRKFLRFILAHIPAFIFGLILMVIPSFVVGMAIILTLNFKNEVIEDGIRNLQLEAALSEEHERIQTEIRIKRLQYYQHFPQNIFAEMAGLQDLMDRKDRMINDLKTAGNSFETTRKTYMNDIDSLRSVLITDDQRSMNAISEGILLRKKEDFNNWEKQKKQNLLKMEAQTDEIKNRIIQIPIAYLLTAIWISIFGGLVLTVLVAYFGNLYHALYIFREDQRPTYLRQLAAKLNSKDHNQPLLGFSLLILTIFIILLLMYGGF